MSRIAWAMAGAACLVGTAAAGCAGGARPAAVGAAPQPAVAAAPAAPAPAVPDSAEAARQRASQDSSEAVALVARGMDEIRSSRDSAAMLDFEAARRLLPRLGSALAGLSVIEAQARHFPAALALADSAVALGDSEPFLTNIRGRSLASMGRCEDAVAILLPFVHANPQWRQPTPELAYCLLNLGRASEAVSVMQVAVRGEPRAPPLHFALLEAFVRAGQLDSALAHARILAQLHPENGLWFVVEGRVLVLLNRMEEARAAFEHGFSERPGLADSLSPMDRSAWQAVKGLHRPPP